MCLPVILKIIPSRPFTYSKMADPRKPLFVTRKVALKMQADFGKAK